MQGFDISLDFGQSQTSGEMRGPEFFQIRSRCDGGGAAARPRRADGRYRRAASRQPDRAGAGKPAVHHDSPRLVRTRPWCVQPRRRGNARRPADAGA